MKAREILNTIREKDEITQQELVKKLGWKSQQQVSQVLTREGSMRVDTFVEMLKAMNYEVIVRKNVGKSEEWVVD